MNVLVTDYAWDSLEPEQAILAKIGAKLIVAETGFIRLPQCQQQLSLWTEFEHHVMADVGHPDIVITVDSQSVGFADQVVTPRADELSVAVKAEDRLLTPMEQKQPPLAVEINSRTLAERYSFR